MHHEQTLEYFFGGIEVDSVPLIDELVVPGELRSFLVVPNKLLSLFLFGV